MDNRHQFSNQGFDRENRYRGLDSGYDDYQQRRQQSGNDDYDRVHYLPDNDENRSRSNRNRFDNGGTAGYGSYGAYTTGFGYLDRDNDDRYRSNANVPRHSDGWGRNQGDMPISGSNMQHNDYGRRNYDDRGMQGRNRGASSGAYRSSYQSNDQFAGTDYRGGSHNDRDWWDRTRDEVASWFGDDDAARRRNIDERREAGAHRGKGPRGYERSHDRIREDVCDRLSDDGMIDASDVEVEVQGNDVILKGKVHSKAEKRRAEDLVESVLGVQHVENRLRIDRDNDNTGNTSWSQSIGL